jgi:hypothetical protein
MSIRLARGAGAADFDGGPLFHVISGNLGYEAVGQKD